MRPISPDFTPVLYPNLSTADNTLLFLECPEREVEEPLASILRLCTGEHTVSDIQAEIPEARSELIFETLEQLGYIVFPQRFVSSRNARPTSKLLVVSPHMDDAFLSVGGIILTWRDRKDIHVIDVFGFDPWITLHTRFRVSDIKQNEWRRREEQFNAALCDCQVEFWDYTGALNRGYSPWNADIDWTRDGDLYKKIKHDILNRVEKQKYEQILFPLAVGGHTDHRLIREVALSLISSLTSVKEICFYEDLPYATGVEHWECWQQLSDYESKFTMSSRYVDISAQVRNKVSLLRTYSSQLLFYEPYSIQQYHHKEHMFTGLPAIDAVHRQSLHRIGNYSERVWVL
jgi:LmbE family N-acetylglucosaminyl deacetylase